MTVEFSLLIALSALIALVPVVKQVRGLGPQARLLREAVAAPGAVRELRFAVREVVVLRGEGNVIALPIRQASNFRPAPVKPELLGEAA